MGDPYYVLDCTEQARAFNRMAAIYAKHGLIWQDQRRRLGMADSLLLGVGYGPAFNKSGRFVNGVMQSELYRA